MKRFLSALSLTFVLYGTSAIAQTQVISDPVDRVVEAGLMSRSSDGDFRADALLSRAELASILVKTFQLDRRNPDQTLVIPMQDVPESHWAYGDIQTVLRNGVMTGYREGRFFPEQRVSRAEAFSIFAQAYGVFQFPNETIDEILAQYPDSTDIPAWARRSMATALYEGFVNIDASRQISPLRPMTRGDMAYGLSQYLENQQNPGL